MLTQNENYWEFTKDEDGNLSSTTFFQVDGEYQPQFQTCVQSLKENLAVSGSYQLLPPDYKIKSVVLRAAPGLYQRIYGSLSRRQ